MSSAVVQVLHQDIVSHRSVLVYMTGNVVPSSISRDSGTRVSDVTRQYSDLCSAVSDQLIRLEKSVSDHEHYRDFIKSIRSDLDQLGLSIASLPDSFDEVPRFEEESGSCRGKTDAVRVFVDRKMYMPRTLMIWREYRGEDVVQCLTVQANSVQLTEV